nr:hypothetical protein CFP56_54923 [Quercus suber]
MVSQDSIDERIFSRIAHYHWHHYAGTIEITKPEMHSSNWRTSPSSSLGDLEAFPLELLFAIFALLDFKTLSDISRTCLRGVEVVRSLPQYRDLMQHAPKALAALGKTRLIRHHLAATVHAALLSTDCISCGRYGAFLHLPLCGRCCQPCLWSNQSLRMISIPKARKCFGISAARVKSLPIMLSVPGTYGRGRESSRQRRIRLVCVGSAKQLAIAENRSEMSMRQDLERKYSAGLARQELWPLRYLLKAQLPLPSSEPFNPRRDEMVPEDKYCGMALLLFPHLAPDHRTEYGFYCLGCELLSRRSSLSCPSYLLPPVDLDSIHSALCHSVEDVVWSRAEILNHIDECSGAKELSQRVREFDSSDFETD